MACRLYRSKQIGLGTVVLHGEVLVAHVGSSSWRPIILAILVPDGQGCGPLRSRQNLLLLVLLWRIGGQRLEEHVDVRVHKSALGLVGERLLVTGWSGSERRLPVPKLRRRAGGRPRRRQCYQLRTLDLDEVLQEVARRRNRLKIGCIPEGQSVKTIVI